jgi:transcriptional regulator
MEHGMPGPALALLRGTLDLLILKGLSWGDAHGFAIARWIESATTDALRIEEGSLYPALHRLEDRGLVAAEWGVSDNNRRARYYRLTPAGRRRLRAEVDTWTSFAGAIFRVLQAPAGPAPAEGR